MQLWIYTGRKGQRERAMFSYHPRNNERFLLAGTPTLVADLNTSRHSSVAIGFYRFSERCLLLGIR